MMDPGSITLILLLLVMIGLAARWAWTGFFPKKLIELGTLDPNKSMFDWSTTPRPRQIPMNPSNSDDLLKRAHDRREESEKQLAAAREQLAQFKRDLAKQIQRELTRHERLKKVAKKQRKHT